MKSLMQKMDLQGKKVVLRCDLNVPFKDGKILDDKKIVESLETIDYLMEQECSVIILSHFGKVKKSEDKVNLTLAPIAEYMDNLYPYPVYFCPETRGDDLLRAAKKLKPKEILVVENTRFEDIRGNKESGNDKALAQFWSLLGDVFINDAFGSCHRMHASVVGIAKYLPSGFGFLVQKEVDALSSLLDNPERPFTVFMGGIKVQEKLPVIKTLLPKCDYLLLGGGIANTFLAALDFNVGFSPVDEESIPELQELMLNNKDKIFLPLDCTVGVSYDPTYVKYLPINKVADDEVIYDIGSATIEKYKQVIMQSKLVFINGTAGKYEDEKYCNGTLELFKVLKESSAKVIAGGGDAVASTKKLGLEDVFYYLSTGGGASLEYIANGSLPAIDFIESMTEDDLEILDMGEINNEINNSQSEDGA